MRTTAAAPGARATTSITAAGASVSGNTCVSPTAITVAIAAAAHTSAASTDPSTTASRSIAGRSTANATTITNATNPRPSATLHGACANVATRGTALGGNAVAIPAWPVRREARPATN